jgi:hypothetical protein
MEWSLLSPRSSRSEVNFPSLCEVKDEHSHLFPSKSIPGMMEHFQPLLITLDKCMDSCPVALAEDVEELLKKDYPNVISDQKLISFNEYVHLARFRGIPIRCDQAFSKPKYMWLYHNKESVSIF